MCSCFLKSGLRYFKLKWHIRIFISHIKRWVSNTVVLLKNKWENELRIRNHYVRHPSLINTVQYGMVCLLNLFLMELGFQTNASQNGPNRKRPHFRLKRPQFSVKTAPYKKSSVKTAPNRKVSVVLCEFSINLNDLTSR